MDMRYTVMLAVGLMIIPLAGAAGMNSTYRQGMLDAAMANAACKADFMDGLIGAIDGAVPSASLGQYADALGNDERTMQGLASSGDWEGFRGYVQGTFDPDMKTAREAVQSWRRGDGRSAGNDTRSALKDDYSRLRAAYDGCAFDSLKGYADAKVQWYTSLMADYQAKAGKLGSEGVQTGDLASLISDADSQIVSPLQSAVDSAGNTTQLRDAIGQYCLFNGCGSGTDFHMAARFESGRLSDVLAYIQPRAQAAGLGGNVTDAQGVVSSVQSELSRIGTSEYAPGQSDEVWSGIRSAANETRDILGALRQS
jgi:hypothetical protein